MNGICLDRDKFWKGYRREFPAELHQPTVDGLNYILDRFERETRLDNIPQFSYCLATAYHESGRKNQAGEFIRFHPVREGKASLASDIWINYQSKYWHTGYFGRGLVQTTHKENYLKIGQLVGVGDQFVREPDLLLQLKWSYESMVAGMVFGIYRRDARGRHTLDRYFPAETASFKQYFNAREIINGDSFRIRKGASVSIGHEIADVAQKFDEILRESQISAQFRAEEINSVIENFQESPATAQVSPADNNPIETPTVDDFAPNSDRDIIEQSTVGNPAENPAVDSLPSPDENLTGDKPDAAPRSWLSVEDLKPFVLRWLKRVWGYFTGANFAQISSLGFAGFNDPQNWWLYIGAIIFILVILFVLALLVSSVLLTILYVNRKEIFSSIKMSKQSLLDPNSYNLGLKFEKK